MTDRYCERWRRLALWLKEELSRSRSTSNQLKRELSDRLSDLLSILDAEKQLRRHARRWKALAMSQRYQIAQLMVMLDREDNGESSAIPGMLRVLTTRQARFRRMCIARIGAVE